MQLTGIIHSKGNVFLLGCNMIWNVSVSGDGKFVSQIYTYIYNEQKFLMYRIKGTPYMPLPFFKKKKTIS